MKPVFVGGCDRSGTTLLGSMLGACRGAVCTPESHFKFSALTGQDVAGDGDGGDPAALEGAVRHILGHWRFRLWETDLEPDELPRGARSYSDLLRWLVREYASRHGAGPVETWVDHTPSNLRFGLVLSDLFPAAKFVHLVRDGRAVASSVVGLDWGPNTALHAAGWWVRKVAYGLAAERELGGDRVLRVRFEDLVTDTEATLERVFGFAGFPRAASAVDGGEFEVAAFHERQHSLVGARPDPDRIDAWREDLSWREVEIFEAEAGEMLEYLGYRREYGTDARPASRIERWMAGSRESLFGQLVNPARLWLRMRKIE